MRNIPGSPDAGFIACALVSKLIETLVERRILAKSDAVQMVGELAQELNATTRALNKPGAEFLVTHIIPAIERAVERK